MYIYIYVITYLYIPTYIMYEYWILFGMILSYYHSSLCASIPHGETCDQEHVEAEAIRVPLKSWGLAQLPVGSIGTMIHQGNMGEEFGDLGGNWSRFWRSLSQGWGYPSQLAATNIISNQIPTCGTLFCPGRCQAMACSAASTGRWNLPLHSTFSWTPPRTSTNWAPRLVSIVHRNEDTSW